MKRVHLLYFVMLLLGGAVLTKLALVQFVEGDYWNTKAESLTTKMRNIEAVRGNIYATDGSLMATSIPIYEVRFDANTDALTDDIFYAEVDSLAMGLAGLFKDKSANDYKRLLVQAREGGSRYMLIRRKVKFREILELKQLPIFRRGRYKGGLILLQQNKRERPFRVLAARTIGYDRNGTRVGLEGAYSEILAGVGGQRLMQKISGGVWMPVSDENEIEPEDGSDIYTTIDLNIQDVAEAALLRQLETQQADHGCVVVMEVKTGAIKAIANLSVGKSGKYWERYNYAIGESTEPGSTIKLASYMVAMEDGYIDLQDSVECGNGKFTFYDRNMYDSHREGFGTITVKRAFEVSSNIGVAKTVTRFYDGNPQRFIDGLYRMGLNRQTGVEIAGEGKPYIKSANEKSWSGISLPWISHGYELQLTPLQILNFYNAVANGGKLMQPQFVREIRSRGKVVERFEPQVLNPAIASKSTVEKAQKMLAGVVQDGTAVNLRNADYPIAGKTGTAQIANKQYGYKYQGEKSYQASFCGYFPADNPQYSCIVVVNAPSRSVYYGNLVAGPIFKEIADKIYSTSIEIHDEFESDGQYAASSPIPYSKNGSTKDLFKVFETIGVKTENKAENNEWAATQTGIHEVAIYGRDFPQNLVPNVKGMGVEDAIHLLENKGLQVVIQGRGAVKNQSIQPGLKIQQGQKIILELA